MRTYTTLSVELEELTKYTEDSAKGFAKVAELVEEQDAALAKFFRSQSRTRSVLAEQMNERLKCIGKEEQDGGTVLGAVHRSFLDLQDKFTRSENIESVIDEAIRGEEMLRDFVVDAMNNLKVADGESERIMNNLKTDVEESLSMLNSKKAMT